MVSKTLGDHCYQLQLHHFDHGGDWGDNATVDECGSNPYHPDGHLC